MEEKVKSGLMDAAVRVRSRQDYDGTNKIVEITKEESEEKVEKADTKEKTETKQEEAKVDKTVGMKRKRVSTSSSSFFIIHIITILSIVLTSLMQIEDD